jgi:antitoxin (DNA-binding transcriptional repressor) of toxin-antitoxin stability system
VEENAESVELSELTDDPEHYTAVLRAGKSIEITSDGRVVAAEPSHLAPADGRSSAFDRLVAAGQVQRATGSLLDLLPPPPAEPGEGSPADEVIRMRSEERY